VTIAAPILAALTLVLALICLTVGALGTTRKLPRNRWFGVRSAETMRNDEAFAVANRVAGPGVICAGAILAMGAVLAFALGGGAGVLVAVSAIVVGVAIAGIIGSLGIRAAAATPEPASDCGQSGGCASCSLQKACSA
jgi:uncharacterized membrane protein